MPQAAGDLTAPTFDFEERAALAAFAFGFERTEGHEAAELSGHCHVTVIPPRRGEEFTINVILPGGVQLVAHTPRREIVVGGCVRAACLNAIGSRKRISITSSPTARVAGRTQIAVFKNPFRASRRLRARPAEGVAAGA